MPSSLPAIDEALNPLHALVLVARFLAACLEEEYGTPTQLPELGLPYSDGFLEEPFSAAPDGRILYPTRALAGVAGLYQHLLDQGMQVVFANDFALMDQGIDAVALDPSSGHYLVCEAKGTTAAPMPFARYLKRTRHKGRQLSWEWCWATLVDYAGYAPTASLFLRLLGPLLNGEASRLLAVTALEEVDGEYAVLSTQVWDETVLRTAPWLDESYDLSRQREWLAEIKHAER